jgi:nucleoside-diphosphate-sugar epimerase
VAAVVHCAGDPRRPRVDVGGTRNLLQTARAAGTPHLVYISIPDALATAQDAGRCLDPQAVLRELVASA